METEDAAKAAAERQSQERQERRAEIDALEEAMDVHRREVEELRRLHEFRDSPEAAAAEPAEAAGPQELETDVAAGTFAERLGPPPSHPELQRLRLHMERAWPEMSMADAFVNFAGKGSDTLYVGIFARVANDLGLTTEESTAIFRILSGDKSFVQLEDWDGLLLGSVVAQPQISNAVQQPPAPPGLAPQDDLGDLGDLSDLSDEEETTTESTTPGSSEDSVGEGSEEESAFSPKEDDHTQLTQQRNDLRALVQVLQAQLKLSEEEANRWQREAHRQEEAATELRERIQLTQVWGTIGSVQAVIKAAGIGFIRPYSGPVDGKDLFFHHSELKNGNFQTLAIGDEVTYEVMMNPVKERTFAANVMLTTK